MRVLVVNDDPAAGTIIATNLFAEGFDVRVVSEPTDAIGVLAARPGSQTFWCSTT